jgi:hypothetical protein
MSNYELALRRDGLFAGLHTTQLSEPIRSERHFTKRPHGKRRSPAFHEVVRFVGTLTSPSRVGGGTRCAWQGQGEDEAGNGERGHGEHGRPSQVLPSLRADR